MNEVQVKRLLLAAFAACRLLAQPDPGEASIEGRVINALTGSPVRKAIVALRSPTSGIALTAETDAEGKFQFFALPAGSYRVSASRSGFLERQMPRLIPLSAKEKFTAAEIRLPMQGVISGRVLDEAGEPVDRAQIETFKQSYRNGRRYWERTNHAVRTNDLGEYRASELPPGRYLVQAYDVRPVIDNQYGAAPKAFFVPTYYPNALVQAQASPIVLGVGAETRGIDIQLSKVTRPPSVRVTGKVTGMPQDSPIIVSVSLLPAEGVPFHGNAMVKAPQYAFDMRVPPGQYRIAANVYSGGPEAYGTGVLNVAADVAGVLIPMTPAPVVAGRVVLAEPGAQVKLQGVKLSLTRLSSGIISENQTDAAGKFVPETLAPGRYTIVSLRSVPDGCFVREVKLGGKEVSLDDFEISTSTQMEIVLSATAASITGRVTGADGMPFPGATITLIPTDGKSWPVKQIAGGEGTFHFTGVRPGKYKLFAWEEVDADMWQDPEFYKNYESHATEITVDPSETSSTQVRTIPADAVK